MATTATRSNTAVKEAMTKSQLLEALSESTGLQRKDVASVLDQLGVVIERHGVPWKGTIPQRVRIPPGNCRSSR